MFMKSRISKIITCLAIAAMFFTVAPAGAVFAAEDENGIDCEWYNFRNNQENNGVTDRTTPVSIDETAMKWTTNHGDGWSSAPTPPLILNGKVYVAAGRKVIEIDKDTGKTIKVSKDMAAEVGYAMNPILYADGKLFVQVGNGIIQAININTFDIVWRTPKIGGQTISPISYANIDGTGYIYTGTWEGEQADGRYMCFTTGDENVINGIKKPTWQFIPSGNTEKDEESDKTTEEELTLEDITYDKDLYETLGKEGNVAKRGFYWAGCYANDKYIAVGSDDGTDEGSYSANAVFYTLNPKTGEIIDKIDQIKGDIRTTTVYHNGYLYFSTKGGHLYKVSVDANGKLGEASYIDLGGMTTASPLVYKNKIYIGVAGPGGQFEADGDHFFAVVDNSTASLGQDSLMYTLPIKGYPQASALLSTAYENEDFDGDGTPDGRVYIYFTYNAETGGIYYTYDTPDQKEAAKGSAELFIPPEDKKNYCISTICADYEGTLYYKNDSGCLMAVETNPAYIKDIKITADNKSALSWDAPFSSRITEYKVTALDTVKTVDLEITAAPDVKVKVDGKEYAGKVTVPLNGAENKAVSVIAEKDKKQRTYTLNLRTTSGIADLSNLLVSTSNTYNNSVINLVQEFRADIYDYDADITKVGENEFFRIWLDAADPASKVEVLAGDNNKNYDKGEAISEKGQGHKYYPVYLKDPSKSETVQIKVTSENGKVTKTYNLRLLKSIDVTGVKLNVTSKQIAKGRTLQLKADIMPEDATNKNVTWSSLDGSVATVDQNGLVTAVGAGKTNISAVSESGSFTATCEITVVDLDDKIDAAKDELAGYKNKDDYNAEEQQVIDSILSKANTKLAEASSEEDLAQIVTDAKAELDKVMTTVQINEMIEGIKNTTITASTKLTANSITVSWKKSEGYDVDSYEVYKSTSSTFGKTPFYKTSTGKTLSVKNSSGLTNNKRYYYKVRGVRTINGKTYYTKWSNTTNRLYNSANAKTIAGVEKTSVTASTKLTANSITVSWKKSAGYSVSYYEVYKSTSSKFGSTPFYKTKTGSTLSVKNSSGLTDGKRYYYRVRGVKTVGGVKYYTKWSPAVSRVYNKNNAKIIAGVESTKITASSAAYKGYTKVSWKRSGSYSMSYYQIYRSTSKSFTSKTVYTSKNSSMKVKGLKKGKKYYYKVRGVRTVGGVKYYSKWSNITYKMAK